jgi:hypothetical protein
MLLINVEQPMGGLPYDDIRFDHDDPDHGHGNYFYDLFFLPGVENPK